MRGLRAPSVSEGGGGTPVRRLRLVCVLCLLVFATGAEAIETRVALVIGNAGYRGLKPLLNPANDARDVAAALRARNFTVIEGTDLDREGMTRAVADFTAKARESDVSLFYYAGHGFQVDGRNYLVPVDAEIRSRDDIERQTVELKRVTDSLEGSRGNHLVFLDACRNNPLRGGSVAATLTDEALRNGLAKVGSAAGFLFSYATQPDNVAFDGGGRNSPFATAFLGHIGTRGQDVGAMMIAVRKDVIAATGGFQVPWENSSLTSQVYFVPGRPEAASPETQLWQLAASSRDPALLRIYLARYTDGAHAGEVQTLLKVASTEPSAGIPRSIPDDRLGDDRLWDYALRSRLRPLVEFYLDRRPDGRHTDEARTLLQNLPTTEDAEIRPEIVCERATTHPRDATANMPGVPLSALAANPEPAIAACRQAREAHPDMPHYTALLARALAAAGRRSEALTYYREAAASGNLRAQVSLGLILETGDGVPRDPKAGIALYETAAEAGSADGAINLAVALMQGAGVATDPKRAVELLKRASEAGSAIATYNLGVLAQDGTIPEQDQALTYFEKATELGEPRGFVPAAILLDEGRGIRKDANAAAEMLLRGIAADTGDAMNQIVHHAESWSPETIRSVQARLKRAGYYDGVVDGRGGPKMSASLQQWRRIGSLDLR
ncbi:peptidase C14, caspase catalytic subunit p20 [Methylobacterium sp. BTF04]|uniref:caspase family protein n=1 Tax=Methylobacterium sp. BTF04 TaxID=2708300 RepID=UPI0013D038B0|nr:caspase family protein [Methylobacterium sp. BTF04]NEU11860.1 peptidase C14, caspase catalytic subunit p20 [Methylobacterium sp. BTF04]